MAQQTAVEYLSEIINMAGIKLPVELINKAKAMEKEQIENALNVGFKEGCKFPDITIDSAEQYYNETYIL